MKKKKVFIITGAALGCVLVLAAAFLLFVLPSLSAFPAIDLKALTPDQKKTLDSLERIDDHPLYTMTYYGDYSQFLALKDKYYKQLGLPEPDCSTFAATGNNGDAILGHNSDSDKASYLLLFTNPSDGYRSVSVVHISEAFGLDKNVKFGSEQEKALMLYSPFFTNNTGMNEMGFAYAVMADPGAKASIDPKLPSMGNGEMQRYLLDHVSSIDEAVSVLEKYNVCFDKEPNHWLFADAYGNSAVVEWVNGSMRIIRNTEPWQVCTNFTLTGAEDSINSFLDEYGRTGRIAEDVNGISYWRYATAWEALKSAEGSVTAPAAMDILKSISLTRSKDVWFDTQYSIVYDLKTKELQIVLDKDYGNALTFNLTTD